jgi:hypothetical protein
MQKISHAQNCFFQFPAFDVEIDIFFLWTWNMILIY